MLSGNKTSHTGTEHSEDLPAVTSTDDERPGIRRRRRRWRCIALEDVLRGVALTEVDEPVVVTDALVPPDRVRHVIAGHRQRLSRAPATGRSQRVVGAAVG